MSNPRIGIIAEDEIDIECIKIFTRRMLPNKQIGFKKFVGHGCGKIKRKANAWARQFKRQMCNSIILIHDLDKNNKITLLENLRSAFLPSPIERYIIVIPVEEMEAWLLADANAIRKVFNIKKNIIIPSSPELISSPKEYLGSLVRKETEKTFLYIHTQHNDKLAKVIDVDEISRKCPSFLSLKNFIEML